MESELLYLWIVLEQIKSNANFQIEMQICCAVIVWQHKHVHDVNSHDKGTHAERNCFPNLEMKKKKKNPVVQ